MKQNMQMVIKHSSEKFVIVIVADQFAFTLSSKLTSCHCNVCRHHFIV